MTALRVAIVGSGLMGRWHAYYAARSGAQVAAIVDPNQTAAASLQQRGFHRAAVYSKLVDCLAVSPIDVVHLCTGSDSHARLAEICLSHGKHLLVEKPVATTLKETQYLLDLAKQKNLKLCAVHQFPFERGIQAIIRNRKRLGEVVRIDYTAYSAGGAGQADHQRRQILREILPHAISLFRAVCKRNMRTSWTFTRYTCDDLTLIGHDGEIEMEVTISLRGRPPRNELVVVGSLATVQVDLFHGFCVWQSGQTGRVAKVLQPLRYGTKLLFATSCNLAYRATMRQPAYPGLIELIKQFYDSILSGKPVPVDYQEMLDAAIVMELFDEQACGSHKLR